MAGQRDVIQDFKMQLRLKEGEFEHWIVPILERYAAFVHLLPASAEHHHSQPGGMWAHSLEVAREAARLANSIELVDVDVDPVERHALLPRWRMAAGMAGLLHDIGKPIADVGAISADGEIWNAFEMPLAAWIEQRAQAGYHFHWRRTKRGKMHEMFGLLGVREVLGGEFLAHLSGISGGFDILLDMFGAIIGNESMSNRLVDIVKQADSRSVAADLERSMRGHAAVGEGARYSLGARLMHGVKELVAAKRWPINRPGSAVWVTDKGVFLVFPEVLRVVREHLVDAGISGIPADPIVLADTLASQGVISVWTSDQGINRKTSRVKIALPEESKFSDVTFTMLRLENPAAHLDGIVNIPPLSAIVLEGADSPGVPLGPVPSPPSEASAIQTQAPAAAEGPRQGQDTAGTPAKEKASESDTLPTSPSAGHEQEVRSAITSRVDPTTRKAIEEATVAMSRAKGAGELLMWICEDLGTGQKRWNEDATDDGSNVALRNPNALTGYGMSPTDAAQSLIKADWIECDPKTPGKRTQRRMFGSKEDNALVLKAEPSRWLRAIACSKEGPSAPAATPTPPSKPPVQSGAIEPPAKAPAVEPAVQETTSVSGPEDVAAPLAPSTEPAGTAMPAPAPAEPEKNMPVVSEVDLRNSAICREMHARLITSLGPDRMMVATPVELKELTEAYAREMNLSLEALVAILRSGNNPIYIRVENSTRVNPQYSPEVKP
jgi:conjugal transfer pilus assembly protein TraI